MQIPKSWWPVINKLSSIQKRPALWIVIDLLAQEASKEGIPLPKAPWETDYKETDEDDEPHAKKKH